jgi:Na+/H+-dicarboxylate symporter
VIILQQFNLPLEGIAIILAVDRVLDMLRTAVNVSGDATVACVVAASEGQLDKDIFNKD